jgi:hypothetical protein
MAKQASIIPNMPGFGVGDNVTGWEEDGILLLAIDTRKPGKQTEHSKQPGKSPSMMVGSTRTFVSVAGGRLMLHYTKPMQVQDVRKSRAIREIAEEDEKETSSANFTDLAAAAKSDPELRKLLLAALKG